MTASAPHPPVTIRAATPDDAAIVRTLVGEIAAHQDQSDAVAGDADDWARMLARPDVVVLLAELEGEPIGYVSAVRRLHLWSAGDTLALDDLFVRAGHRDRGVGLLLMQAIARHAGGLTITWGVEPDNHAAIRFYERLGATVRSKVTCAWPADRQPRDEADGSGSR